MLEDKEVEIGKKIILLLSDNEVGRKESIECLVNLLSFFTTYGMDNENAKKAGKAVMSILDRTITEMIEGNEDE